RAAQELKTKPTQHSVKELLNSGVQPDILVCRTEKPLTQEIRKKLALFCNVNVNSVIEAIDAHTIYDVPVLMKDEHLDTTVLNKLHLDHGEEPLLDAWQSFLHKLKNPSEEIRIGLIGKYIELQDAYKSIYESFVHAGAVNECKVQVVGLHSEDLEKDDLVAERLAGLHGVLVAPGFGERGIEGKIRAIQYVREHKIPFFGICLGMQCAVVEFARNVLHMQDAASTEVSNKTAHPVIDLMSEQKTITKKGGTMRLGAYACDLVEDSHAHRAYHTDAIQERHRHRYEFNSEYLEIFESGGLRSVGTNPESGLVEIMELVGHPWFVGVQFHPELKSTVENPHPLFVRFVEAAIRFKQGINQKRAEFQSS
ncbi:MAG: CTP synthase, partial [Saprospiraceae bacterium]|nr:CTP synthase [Saprospiraceae bacterium]